MVPPFIRTQAQPPSRGHQIFKGERLFICREAKGDPLVDLAKKLKPIHLEAKRGPTCRFQISEGLQGEGVLLRGRGGPHAMIRRLQKLRGRLRRGDPRRGELQEARRESRLRLRAPPGPVALGKEKTK